MFLSKHAFSVTNFELPALHWPTRNAPHSPVGVPKEAKGTARICGSKKEERDMREKGERKKARASKQASKKERKKRKKEREERG